MINAFSYLAGVMHLVTMVTEVCVVVQLVTSISELFMAKQLIAVRHAYTVFDFSFYWFFSA